MKKLLYSASIMLVAGSIFLFSCNKDDDGGSTNNIDCTATDLGATNSVNGDDITVTALRGKAPYTYSIDGTNFQASNIFNDKAVGDYTITVKDANNCTATSSASVNKLLIDGQTYNTVKIGNQVWMAENLNKTTATSSDCCENTTDTCRLKGVLYTYTEAQTVCPAGWHLPTNADWSALEAHIGMTPEEIAISGDWRGDKAVALKTGGSSGFNAVQTGYYSTTRCEDPSYTVFWINDQSNNYAIMNEINIGIKRSNQTSPSTKHSVRCIQNQ